MPRIWRARPVRKRSGDRQHADQRGEPDQQNHDADDQGFLIVRPEVRDREVLDRDGSQVDRGLPGRHDRSAARAGDRGRELGYAQRHGARQQAGISKPGRTGHSRAQAAVVRLIVCTYPRKMGGKYTRC
jgi:hypothetical protein